MSERRPGYDRGDQGRASVAPRDAAICEAVQGRHDPDGTRPAGWPRCGALAAVYHRDGDQADGCNLAAAPYEPRPRG